VQILHPFAGSIQKYAEQIADPDRYRPDHCPQCQTPHSLIAHGFYSRTLVDAGFDDSIRVRRYLCRSCRRTVSLLPEFALPYLRFSISVIALFLVARLLQGATLAAAAVAAAQSAMPYQRGQFWIRRFQRQATTLCAALAALAAPPPAANFVRRALNMLQSIGWIAAHRFLFADLRFHLLGWPAFLAPDGRLDTGRKAAIQPCPFFKIALTQAFGFAELPETLPYGHAVNSPTVRRGAVLFTSTNLDFSGSVACGTHTAALATWADDFSMEPAERLVRQDLAFSVTATAIPVASDVTIGTGVSGHAWLHLFYYLAAARATLCAWNTLHWHQTRSVLLGFGFGLQAVQPYVLCKDCGWPQTHISCGSIGGLRPVGLERVGATARFLIGLAANFFCRSGGLGLWCLRP